MQSVRLHKRRIVREAHPCTKGEVMSDTSHYDAVIFEQKLITEDLRQQAARKEIEYWMLRMEKEGFVPTPARDRRGE